MRIQRILALWQHIPPLRATCVLCAPKTWLGPSRKLIFFLSPADRWTALVLNGLLLLQTGLQETRPGSKSRAAGILFFKAKIAKFCVIVWIYRFASKCTSWVVWENLKIWFRCVKRWAIFKGRWTALENRKWSMSTRVNSESPWLDAITKLAPRSG